MRPSGTGPTRRSHTKSRKGCKTCKRRHIRCDENFPQCGNCTKHNVRCDYMDLAGIEAEPPQQNLGNPDLRMTPKIEQDLQQWRETGVNPFPSLGVKEHPTLSQYSNTDLRLIHHISSIAEQMQNAESQQSVWIQRVPLFLKLASSHDFVKHALLALSASHLAWLTSCAATEQLSYHHRGIALNTLSKAIGSFSKDNADAVLAASILLSWQDTDCGGWKGLMKGTTAVIEAIHKWKGEIEFSEFLEEHSFFNENPRPRCLSPQDMARLLNDVFNSLRVLEPYVKGREEESKGLNDLIMFVRNLAAYIPFESEDEQFELLHPLRNWLFFLPISFLKRAKEDKDVMILLAHFYAVALAVEPLFPAVGAAWFGSLAIGPILEIHRYLLQQHLSMKPSEQQTRWPIELMEFPLQVIRDFRIRMGWRPAGEVAAEAAARALAQEMPFPPSPSVSGSEATTGETVARIESDEVFDITQLADIQVEPLPDEDFFEIGLWRGWSQ